MVVISLKSVYSIAPLAKFNQTVNNSRSNELRIDAAEMDKVKTEGYVPPHQCELN